jgi:hypothetical protein
MILPFVSAVDDYHDFEEVVRHFRNADIKLKYIELGCFKSKFWNKNLNGYHAVFYCGERTKEVDDIVEKWKQE